MHRLSRFMPFACAVLMAVVLSACSVRLVSDYDAEIDRGLTQFNTDLTAFVNKMIAVSNTPAGTYSSNQDFYIAQDAKLSTLVVRAEAHKALNSCPSTQVIKKALQSVTPPSSSGTAPLPIPMPDPAQVAAQIGENDCSVVLLNLIRTGLDQMRQFHMVQNQKGIPAAAHDPLLVGGLGSLVRAALTVEIAKKTGGSVGGAS